MFCDIDYGSWHLCLHFLGKGSYSWYLLFLRGMFSVKKYWFVILHKTLVSSRYHFWHYLHYYYPNELVFSLCLPSEQVGALVRMWSSGHSRALTSPQAHVLQHLRAGPSWACWEFTIIVSALVPLSWVFGWDCLFLLGSRVTLHQDIAINFMSFPRPLPFENPANTSPGLLFLTHVRFLPWSRHTAGYDFVGVDYILGISKSTDV